MVGPGGWATIWELPRATLHQHTTEGHIQGQPTARYSPASSLTLAPWQSSTSDGTSKFVISIEAVNINIKMVPVLGHLPTEVKITILRLGCTRGMEALLTPGAFTESAPFSSLSYGASSDGPPGKADPHSLGTPSMVATFWAEWTLIQLRYVCSSPSPSLAGLIRFSASGFCTALSWVSSSSIAVGESTGGYLLLSSLSWTSPTPSSISCLLQVMYLPTCCLISLTHLVKQQGSPHTCRLTFSVQYCSALAYARVIWWGFILTSWHGSASSRNSHLQMHFGAGSMVNSWPSRASILTDGTSKEAWIFLSQFLNVLHISYGNQFLPPMGGV